MKNGFTIVELVVVVSIMAIVSGIAFTVVKQGDRALALDRASYKLAQDFRRTAQMALRGEGFACPDPESGTVVGYGIHFDTSRSGCYLVYAECDNDTQYRGPSCDTSSTGMRDGVVERIPLEQGIEISSLSLGTPTDVLFVPPYPITYINGDVNPDVRLEVRLSPVGYSGGRTVEITQRGVITIE